MSKYHRDDSQASDPLTLELSEGKLQKLQPELYGWRRFFFSFPWMNKRLRARQAVEMLAEHMQSGDSRAAMVVSETPLVVAAYTDEIDCVALLRFPDSINGEYHLRAGARLLTVNTYGSGKRLSPDLTAGPATTGRMSSFFPIIAEFVSDNIVLIERRKQSIAEQEWRRTWEFAQAKLRDTPWAIRDGRPLNSWRSARSAN